MERRESAERKDVDLGRRQFLKRTAAVLGMAMAPAIVACVEPENETPDFVEDNSTVPEPREYSDIQETEMPETELPLMPESEITLTEMPPVLEFPESE